MRRPGDLQQGVERAEAHVAAAMRFWRAGQPSCGEECHRSIEHAIRELMDAQRDAEQCAAIPAAPLRKRLEQLKADVDRLARLVDAATAFCRGMTLTIGRDGAAFGVPRADELAPTEGVA